MLDLTFRIDIQQDGYDVLFPRPPCEIDIIFPDNNLKPRKQFRNQSIEELIVCRHEAHDRQCRMKKRRGFLTPLWFVSKAYRILPMEVSLVFRMLQFCDRKNSRQPTRHGCHETNKHSPSTQTCPSSKFTARLRDSDSVSVQTL